MSRGYARGPMSGYILLPSGLSLINTVRTGNPLIADIVSRTVKAAGSSEVSFYKRTLLCHIRLAGTQLPSLSPTLASSAWVLRPPSTPPHSRCVPTILHMTSGRSFLHSGTSVLSHKNRRVSTLSAWTSTLS